jgi:DNA-binding GntR family transcriptional regulator
MQYSIEHALGVSAMTQAQLPEIQRSSLRDQIRELLIEQIVQGRLTAGSRVNESALARSLGVSQTPIREALLRLEGELLVVSSPGRGFLVADVSEQELVNLYHLIADLEELALRQAPPPEPERLERLRAANARLARAAGRRRERSLLNKNWHEMLLECCTNRLLLKELQRLYSLSMRYEQLFWDHLPEIDTSTEEHEEILSHLARGDSVQATQVLRQNWLKSIGQLAAEVRSMETSTAPREAAAAD